MNLYFLDDDYMINRYHELTLTSTAADYDCSIEFFEDPDLLFEKCLDSHHFPDLIFLDINMPIMDGWDFIEEFNRRYPISKTKFVILTTSDNPSSKERANTIRNVHDFTNKPLSNLLFASFIKQIAANPVE